MAHALVHVILLSLIGRKSRRFAPPVEEPGFQGSLALTINRATPVAGEII